MALNPLRTKSNGFLYSLNLSSLDCRPTKAAYAAALTDSVELIQSPDDVEVTGVALVVEPDDRRRQLRLGLLLGRGLRGSDHSERGAPLEPPQRRQLATSDSGESDSDSHRRGNSNRRGSSSSNSLEVSYTLTITTAPDADADLGALTAALTSQLQDAFASDGDFSAAFVSSTGKARNFSSVMVILAPIALLFLSFWAVSDGCTTAACLPGMITVTDLDVHHTHLLSLRDR